MSLSKLPFSHLKSLAPRRHGHPLLPLAAARRLSFASPEDAAAERRRRKRQLRIEPPLSSVRRPPQPQSPRRPPNPNAPKLPESPAALAGRRLDLHNHVLSLVRAGDLDEAALLVRHSVYSNCKPTIFTVNAVLNALLRQRRYSDLLVLHRFITQASIAPTIVTYNLVLQTYCDARKPDVAVDNFRLLTKPDSPVSPSPTTFRILTRGLVDNGNVDQAIEIKNSMPDPDPVVYDTIMSGLVDHPDRAISLYNELKADSVPFAVCGSLMKAYFKKGMEAEAMDAYKSVVDGPGVRFGAVSYNSVLEALTKNGKLEEAEALFERMMEEHDAPGKISVNLGSFNVMVDAYCGVGRFEDAVKVFWRMEGKKCKADAISYNNLIKQLGENRLVAEAEEIYKEMPERGVSPDEYTYVLLVEACFGVDRVDDAAGYFRKMVEGLRPTAAAYNKVIGGLVSVGRVDEAEGFFNTMVEKEVKPNAGIYELMVRAFLEVGRLDDAMKKVRSVYMDDLSLSEETRELVEAALMKEGREELETLIEEVKREKAEAAALAAEEKARAEALAAEEEARKKAEEAAKKEESDRRSAASLKSIINMNKPRVKDAESEVGASEGESGIPVVEAGASEGEPGTPVVEAGATDGESLKDQNDTHSVEEAELVEEAGATDGESMKDQNDTHSVDEAELVENGDAAEQVTIT